MSWVGFVLACLAWPSSGFWVPANGQTSEQRVTHNSRKALATLLNARAPSASRVGRAPRDRNTRQALMGLRGGTLISAASRALAPQEDSHVVAVASCGAGLTSTPAVIQTLGASQDAVSVVPLPTPVVLFNVASASDSETSVALAAADVLTVEIRFDDLVKRTAHGLAQLPPLLRKLDPSKPSLLLIIVTDHDAAEASEAEVSAFIHRELSELTKSLELQGSDLWKAKCAVLPSSSSSDYESALGQLREILTVEASAFSSPAFETLQVAKETAGRIADGKPLSATPTDVHLSYRVSLLAKQVLREFQADALALQVAADAGLLADFGDRATAVMSKALESFDAAALGSKLPVAATRTALVEQMYHVLRVPFRKQLAILQKETIASFLATIEEMQPSAKLDVSLEQALKQTMKEFEASAKQLLPSRAPWSYSYERDAMLEYMRDSARKHVQAHQAQGLHLSKKRRGLGIPVDFSLHWLSLNPFSRQDSYEF